MIGLDDLKAAARDANVQFVGDIEPLLMELGLDPAACFAVAGAHARSLKHAPAPTDTLLMMAFVAGMQLAARAIRKQGGR